MRTPQSIKLGKVFTYSALIVFLTLPLGALVTVHAESTRIFLDPASQTVSAKGDSFTVNVSISDVSNLYGYELKLYYNSTLMNGTKVIEGSFLKSGGGQTFFYTVNFTDNYNSTHGLLYVSSTLMGNVSGVSGSGVLATAEFRSLALGNSSSLHLADVKLSDPDASSISHEDSDGAVTVVPEFSSLFAIFALIIASLSAIIFEKRVMCKPEISNRSNAGAFRPQIVETSHDCISEVAPPPIAHSMFLFG